MTPEQAHRHDCLAAQTVLRLVEAFNPVARLADATGAGPLVDAVRTAATRYHDDELSEAARQLGSFRGPQLDFWNRIVEHVGEGSLDMPADAVGQLADVRQRYYPEQQQEGGLHGEDDILGPLLPEEGGCYVDVGAWRPVEQSNTWRFYQRGWRGLLVEPIPAAWACLLAQRPGDYLCPLIASNRAGVARIWANGPTSSVRPDLNVRQSIPLVLPTDTLSHILAQFPVVRDTCLLCSIDVEGAEKEVLEGIDWNTFSPRVLVIEFIDPLDRADRSGEWLHLVAKDYKEHARTENNIICIRQ